MSVIRGVCRAFIALAALLALAVALGAWQRPSDRNDKDDIKLPSGKSQREEILKDEHKKSLRDVAEILDLAAALKTELEESDYLVLSIPALKKAEEIERIAKRIKSRLRR